MRSARHILSVLRVVTALAMSWGCAGKPLSKAAVRVDAEPGGGPETAGVADRASIDGRDFPDGVLALTWDDGPDVNTVALATFLARSRVSATFFVVREWVPGVSSDPGEGADLLGTGYAALPVLGELVSLGHRIGNHTSHHPLLTRVASQVAAVEIRENQRGIDPFLSNELRIVRAPGGAWDEGSSRSVAADPYMVDWVGPVRWDIDRKDWAASLDCEPREAATDCEAIGARRRLRVRPGVVAARYLETIERQRHGIVLLHDRVGSVGSRFALDVAERLVPELARRGFVFAAPILRFVDPQPRDARTSQGAGLSIPLDGSVTLADLDGDGRADVCSRAWGERRCARSVALPGTDEDLRPRTVFEDLGGAPCRALVAADEARFADVDGDGRADVCAPVPTGIACALASRGSGCEAPRQFLDWTEAGGREGGAVRYGDVDGDGKADACRLFGRAIVCARSLGSAFERERSWSSLADDASRPTASDPLELADVDGDGKADACCPHDGVLECRISTGDRFGSPTVFSTERAFTESTELLFADLNGDGRADVCERSSGSVDCALSSGRRFTQFTPWLTSSSPDAARLLRGARVALGDVNGDRRADLCGADALGVVCALAP